jgi:site-specific DNA-methyltransferase (adenine-specific)
MATVWNIPYLNPKANEKVGYPTQKPILLMDDRNVLVMDSYELSLGSWLNGLERVYPLAVPD